MIAFRRDSLKRWGGGLLTTTILMVVAWLVYRQFRNLEWAEVITAFGEYDTVTVVLALSIAIIGFTAVSLYDLIGRHYTGHSLSLPRVLATSYIGYTFSLNLGALVGGVGFRYRLYLKAGLSTQTSTKVIGLSVLANWSGYVLLVGLLFTFAPPALPESWLVRPSLLRMAGGVLLVTSAAYVWCCWRHAGKSWEIKGFTLVVPTLGIAIVQFVLSILSWCSISAIIYVLLPEEIGWYMVLTAMLSSSIAAVLTHIPGGIGVIELVFITLLGHLAAESSIVAALLGFRCVYYLLPLFLALLLYVVLELNHAQS